MTKPTANRIAERRKQRGLTQQQLADKLGVHWITVSKLERGVMQLTFDWGDRIAEALGFEFGDIIPESQNREIEIEAVIKNANALEFESTRIRARMTRDPMNETASFWVRLGDNSLEPYYCEGDLLQFSALVMANSDGSLREWRSTSSISLIIADDETKHLGVFVERRADGAEDFRLLNGRPLKNQKKADVLVITGYLPSWAIGDIAE